MSLFLLAATTTEYVFAHRPTCVKKKQIVGPRVFLSQNACRKEDKNPIGYVLTGTAHSVNEKGQWLICWPLMDVVLLMSHNGKKMQ